MRKFSPHLSIGIRWRKERWMGGFPPHLSISIRWREQMWMGGFPHIFSSVSYRGKEGGWGDSRTPLRSIRWPKRWWSPPGGLVGFPPHVSVRIPIFVFQYKMGERRLTGGFLPQLSIRIRWEKPICQYYVVRKNALSQSRFVRQR